MAKSYTLSFTVPEDIKLKLDAVSKIGHYDSLSEFLRDSIRSHLNNNKDIRIAVAYQLFKAKKISLAKSAEIIKEPISEVKQLFREREI